MKRSTLLLLLASSPFALALVPMDGCIIVECTRDSHCPNEGDYCRGGLCQNDDDYNVSGGGTGGSPDPSGGGGGSPDPSGGGGSPGGGCQGFEFQAQPRTVSEWGCQVENPNIFLPLDPWTVSPRVTTQDIEEAQTLHEAAICQEGCPVCAPDKLPLNWASLADDLADDAEDRCLTHLTGGVCDQPGGVFQNPKTALCAQFRDIYRSQININVPKMERVGCTNGTIFPCQGPDEGADGSSGGGDGTTGGAGAVTAGWEVTYELDLEDGANQTVPLPWDFSDVYCGRRGDCKVTEEFVESLWASSAQFETDGVTVYPADVRCLTCEDGTTMGLELRLRHDTIGGKWKPSQSEQLFQIFGLESGDTITSIAYGPDLDNMAPLESVAGGTINDLVAERALSGSLRGVYQLEVIDRRGRFWLRTVTVE